MSSKPQHCFCKYVLPPNEPRGWYFCCHCDEAEPKGIEGRKSNIYHRHEHDKTLCMDKKNEK